jgi:hypothetical protein
MLGSCSAAESAVVHINEMTTVAAAYAMSGFIAPANFGLSTTTAAGDSIGSSYSATPTYAANNNNIVGLNNAVNTAAVLVNNATGFSPGATSNGTVDTVKMNTLADILAYCVNSDPTAGSTHCSTLFADVSPASSAATPTATNTFEAAYYLCQNPTNSQSSIATVNGFAASAPPFTPTLTSAPTDWTLGVNYAATGMTAGQRLAIDPLGNVWVTSANSTSGGQVTEFGPTGSVLTTFTGSYGAGPTLLTAPMGIAIDNKAIQNLATNGGSNVAVADSGTNSIFVFNEGTSDASPAFSQIVAGSATTGEEPYAVGFGTDLGMYITETTTTQIGVTQTPIALKSAYGSSTGVSTYGTVGADKPAVVGPFGIVNSHDNTVFVIGQAQSGSGTAGPPTPTSFAGAIRNFVGSTLTGNSNAYSGTAKASYPTGAVFDASGNLWFANAAYAVSNGTVYGPAVSPATTAVPTNSFLTVTAVTTGSPDSLSTSPFPSAAGAGGLNNARYLAIDGSNNLWVANAGGVTNGSTTTYGVSEFLNSGLATPTALSPATTGYVQNMSMPNDIAIDGSGNVWVVNGGPVNYVTEIVGAASPAVTPLDYNIRYSTWGKRP